MIQFIAFIENRSTTRVLYLANCLLFRFSSVQIRPEKLQFDHIHPPRENNPRLKGVINNIILTWIEQTRIQ